jgi:hypothetical protein
VVSLTKHQESGCQGLLLFSTSSGGLQVFIDLGVTFLCRRGVVVVLHRSKLHAVARCNPVPIESGPVSNYSTTYNAAMIIQKRKIVKYNFVVLSATVSDVRAEFGDSSFSMIQSYNGAFVSATIIDNETVDCSPGASN